MSAISVLKKRNATMVEERVDTLCLLGPEERRLAMKKPFEPLIYFIFGACGAVVSIVLPRWSVRDVQGSLGGQPPK